MTTYSHSRLAVFENCPRAYKFAYIEKPDIEEFETADAFMGSRVHEVLEHLYKDLKHERRNSLDDLLVYYDKIWSKNWSDQVKIIKEGLTEKNYKKVGERCIRDYYQRYQPFGQGRTIATELRVKLTVCDYTLQGFIDRLTAFPNGFYEIHDYKASQNLPAQEILDTDRQLGLYQIGIQQRWRDVKRVDLVWHYLAFDRELRSERTEGQLEELKQSVLSLIRQIERAKELDEFPIKRNNCDWCEFQDLCPEWGHMRKVGALPANEFLGEPGVKLVNKWTKLKQREDELALEKEKLREAILDLAKREGVSRLIGSDKQLYIRIGKQIKFPGSGEGGREELEEMIKEAGRWEEVSSLDIRSLRTIAREGSWPPELLKKLKLYQSIEESSTLRLANLKEDDF